MSQNSFLFEKNIFRGNCTLIHLGSDVILYRRNFRQKVRALSFSNDSNFVAVGTQGKVFIFSVADISANQFVPLALLNRFMHSENNINAIGWSFDGSLIAVAGNRIAKIFKTLPDSSKNLGGFTFGERASVVGVWFFNENNEFLSVDKSGICSIFELEDNSEKLIFERKIRKCLTSLIGVTTNLGLLSASVNKQKKLLATGFSNGTFCIFDIPGLSLLQNFSIGDKQINSINFNSRGDWLAIGCGRGMDAQLIVWEWQSESHILKQQSHSQTITAIAYSPDGSILATGAEDGKVREYFCK
uniref:Translation initiation factor beta propellor-like domain-containing protein n=1 Tax=Meloidogyne incognita TaxID=6306 RepID=A0A914KZZ6_MELIC